MIRTKSREVALQLLFMLEDEIIAGKPVLIDEIIENFREQFDPGTLDRILLAEILHGVQENLPLIDKQIQSHSRNWKINRINRIDRNVLRIAIYELMFCDSIAAKVSMDEAINLGKQYGTDDSGAFINGIIDVVWKSLPKNPNKVE